VVVAAYRALPGEHMSGGYANELSDVAGRVSDADVLVAVDGPDVVGCVTYVPDAASAWAEMLEDGEAGIRMLGTDPSWWGRGVGRMLLDACIARAVDQGRVGLCLHTTPWMETAHRMYLRAGFVRTPERDWSPAPEVPLVAFRLDLPA
jgi:GNAT superfamily N-acetyltransferase